MCASVNSGGKVPDVYSTGEKERVKPGPGWIKELKIKCEFSVTISSVRSGGFSYTVSRRTRPKT